MKISNDINPVRLLKSPATKQNFSQLGFHTMQDIAQKSTHELIKMEISLTCQKKQKHGFSILNIIFARL